MHNTWGQPLLYYIEEQAAEPQKQRNKVRFICNRNQSFDHKRRWSLCRQQPKQDRTRGTRRFRRDGTKKIILGTILWREGNSIVVAIASKERICISPFPLTFPMFLFQQSMGDLLSPLCLSCLGLLKAKTIFGQTWFGYTIDPLIWPATLVATGESMLPRCRTP